MVYNPYTDTAVYLNTLQLPHVTSINIPNEWDQTELPIERGAVITDHRRKRPRSITITGYVTGQIQLIPTGSGSLLGQTATRTAMNVLAEEGRLLTVKWKDRKWPNMTIVSFSEDYAAERRDDMYAFTLVLKETRIASSTTVAASTVDPSIEDLTAAPVDGGPQAATAVGPETAAEVGGVVGGAV